MGKKRGKYFEDLVTWVQQCTHEKAVVTSNDKIPDTDTNRKRQVDISIRLSDGSTEFFGMVEVRDRNKPIGVGYIEEINSKKQSVGADAASIVSRSGFTKPALKKAKKLNMRTLTYEEATKKDWSGWINCKTMLVFARKYEKTLVYFFKDKNQILKPSPKVIKQIKADSKTKVLLGKDGKPIMSLFKLGRFLINQAGDVPFEGLKSDGKRERRRLFFKGPFEPEIYIIGEDRHEHKIVNVAIEADFYIEKSQSPMKLSRYRKTESGKSIAEVATADVKIGEDMFRVDLIVPGAGDYIPAGAKIRVRASKLE